MKFFNEVMIELELLISKIKSCKGMERVRESENELIIVLGFIFVFFLVEFL